MLFTIVLSRYSEDKTNDGIKKTAGNMLAVFSVLVYGVLMKCH